MRLYTCVVLVNMVNYLCQLDKGNGNEGGGMGMGGGVGRGGMHGGTPEVETNKNSMNTNHSFFGHNCS